MKSEIMDGPPCDLEIPQSVNFFTQTVNNSPALGTMDQTSIASSSINYSQATGITKNLTREQQQMHSILEALMNFTDADDRIISEVFYKLPSKIVRNLK